ncbi:MAG: murein transglycosylase A [Thiothrix sp.]|nr:murein transglycosylase A [Thiothrix sp.]HPQ95520.1 murein transglycosylase A [Thiolinea sp.]
MYRDYFQNRSFRFILLFLLFLLPLSLWLRNCHKDRPPAVTPGLREPIGALSGEMLDWADLPGWNRDRQQEAWPALLKNCRVMHKKPLWGRICQQAETLPAPPDQAGARRFFEENFTPYRLFSQEGRDQGFMTGYYEPLLMGSYTRDERFKYPLYGPPRDMLTVELDSLFPELKGKRVRGRLDGNRVIPYYSRAEIEVPDSPLAGQEILWVDDHAATFFLQVQGSGRVQLPDGKVIGAGYANQNGQPYVAIGKTLMDWGEVEPGKVNLFVLREWLKNHPDRAQALMNTNPSYVFFSLRENVEDGPTGSLNVPLTAERSIAIDRKAIELGSLLFVDSRYPAGDKAPLQKLVFAQDTGGAIRGDLRADFFFGTGEQAEKWAGTMKQDTHFYFLKPKPAS